MNEMNYVEAPNYDLIDTYPLVFLGGGITGCPDWQKILVDLLKDVDIGTLANPRRENFDITDKTQTPIQIKWEFDHLWLSDIIIFWFCKETIQPIVLLELGARLGQCYLNKHEYYGNLKPTPPVLVIGIEEGYSREQDVIAQTTLAMGVEPVISRTLEDVAIRVKTLLKGINI
jgi:hypothetical protein